MSTIFHDWQYHPGFVAPPNLTIVRAAAIFRRRTGLDGRINGRNYWELRVEGEHIVRSSYYPTMEQAIFAFSTFIQRLPGKDISHACCCHETFPINQACRRFTIADAHIFDTICAWRNDILLFMQNSSLQEDSYTCPFELMEVTKPNSLAKPAVADFEEV